MPGEEKTYTSTCDKIIFAPGSNPVVRQVSMSANAPWKVNGDKFESIQQKLSLKIYFLSKLSKFCFAYKVLASSKGGVDPPSWVQAGPATLSDDLIV